MTTHKRTNVAARAIWPIVLAVGLTASAAEWRPVPGNIMTPWAAKVDPAKPLPEHPRPQLVRGSWQNINGLWQFEIAAREAPQPAQFSKQILVPYPVESALSGIKQRVSQKDRLWYQRGFTVPDTWRKGRVLLHFTASDWSTEVIVNGRPAGKHDGGYDPFEFDITDFLTNDGGQSLAVSVWDPTADGGQPHGKQTLVKHNIFYTSSSGIWGTVWLEAVPKSYVKSIRMVPDIDAGTLKLTVSADAGTVSATARDGQTKVAEATGRPGGEIVLRIPNAKLWTPDTPFLYDLDIDLTNGASHDTVRSYFGMRKVSIGPDEKGVTRILLNNKFVFQTGPLDQGWWPDGLYTAPTDEALKYDIETIKAHGFNMVRKHIKIEPERWHYWCDKLGVMVWQDMPSCGRGIPGDSPPPAEKPQFELELKRMVETNINHPSLIMWIIFNEGWGQHDTERLAGLVKTWDSSRLVNEASGGMFKGAGDVIDDHLYPFPSGPKPTANRASVSGECGGLGFNVAGHTWNDEGWGYIRPGLCGVFPNSQELAARYEEVVASGLKLGKENGTSAVVYTQLADIETENNGLMTYDRAVHKIKPEVTKALLNGWLPPRKTSPACTFVGTGRVALEPPAENVGIVYSLDGSDPTAKSAVYQKPIGITRDTVVKARAVWPGGGLSRVLEFEMREARPDRQLITNPGFEDGSSPWLYSAPVLIDGEQDIVDSAHHSPHGGKKHFRLQAGRGETVTLTQAVAIPAGDWELAMWLMSRDSATNNVGPDVTLDLLDEHNKVVAPAQSSSPDHLAPMGKYVRWTRHYRALKPGDYTVRISTGKPSDKLFKQGWVDDVSLIQKPDAPPAADGAILKGYVDRFNAAYPENLVNAVSDADACRFLEANIPLLECPDKVMEEVYYFRWWTYRKHIRKTPAGFVVTEFLPNVGWAKAYNTINCPVGHQIYEGRWLRDPKVMDDYIAFYFGKGGDAGGGSKVYSNWLGDAIYARYLVNHDRDFVTARLDGLIANHEAYSKGDAGTGRSRLVADVGLYWQIDSWDGMEHSIGGTGIRPTISSYMYGNAKAIAGIAKLAGREEVAKRFQAEAEGLKQQIQQKLWDSERKFFKVLRYKGATSDYTSPALEDCPDGGLVKVRELIGYIPWYFNLPDDGKGYEEAWKQLVDPQGFKAPYGPTFAERRHPKFQINRGGCEWRGASWPYATSQTLTAMANLLNNYRQQAVGKKEYFDTLRTYAASHYFSKDDGSKVAWIDESLDPDTGRWITNEGGFPETRGRYYNHSSFCDLVITGLIGLRPRADDVIEVNPLLPDGTWDWFRLDNIAYHGKNLTIQWDKTGNKYGKGAGLLVFADGKLIAKAGKLERIEAKGGAGG